jgi:hypothetical protein
MRFCEWQITMEASRSSTRPGTRCPAAIESDGPARVSAARAQASSRAWARARPQLGQRLGVQIGWHPPRGGIAGHRAEQVRLVTQHREVSDRLTAVGAHHRQVHRDPTGVMTRLPGPATGPAHR